MSEFSVPPYIYFYPSDWLQNPEVRRLPPDVKGFYIDLICQLHYCFPYGYISLLNPLKAKQLQKSVNQKSNHEVNIRVELLVSVSVSEQLKFAENIESELHKYIPYDTDTIAMYLNKLEENNIISRSPSGIIYVRRMVKDFKRRVVAYLNGSKGGNPNMKNRKKDEKSTKKKAVKQLVNKDLQNQPNQNSNQPALPTTDPIYNDNIGRGFREKGESVRGENIFVFQMQEIYDKTFKQLQEVAYSKQLTEEGFRVWREFVDWIVENEYTALFQSKFINPPDFEKLWNKGFVKTKWKAVIERILATGIKPEHSLYFRIPEFEKYVNRDSQKTSGTAQVVGKKDFSQMKGVVKSAGNGT